MTTLEVLIVALQAIIGLALVPMGVWMFNSNRLLGVLSNTLDAVVARLNGSGLGIPARCELENLRIESLERDLAELVRQVAKVSEQVRDLVPLIQKS